MAKRVQSWGPKILCELIKHDACRRWLVERIGANSTGQITNSLNNLFEKGYVVETECKRDKPACKRCIEYFRREKKVGRPPKNKKAKTGPKASCLTVNFEKIFDILDDFPDVAICIRKNLSVLERILNHNFSHETIKKVVDRIEAETGRGIVNEIYYFIGDEWIRFTDLEKKRIIKFIRFNEVEEIEEDLNSEEKDLRFRLWQRILRAMIPLRFYGWITYTNGEIKITTEGKKAMFDETIQDLYVKVKEMKDVEVPYYYGTNFLDYFDDDELQIYSELLKNIKMWVEELIVRMSQETSARNSFKEMFSEETFKY